MLLAADGDTAEPVDALEQPRTVTEPVAAGTTTRTVPTHTSCKGVAVPADCPQQPLSVVVLSTTSHFALSTAIVCTTATRSLCTAVMFLLLLLLPVS